MKVLITGAGGFVGSSLVNQLRGFTIFPTFFSKHFRTHNRNIFFDLTNTKHIKELVSSHPKMSFDAIVHCAAITPFSKKTNPLNFMNDLVMAESIVTLCKAFKVKKLLFASGWVVYNPSLPTPFKEAYSLQPNTAYGKSKLAVEQFFKKNVSPAAIINIRFSTLYGSGQVTQGLIPNLTKSALKKKSMSINAVATRRDYLYIDDAVDAIKNILLAPVEKNLDINVGSNNSYRTIDIALSIQKIVYDTYRIPAVLKLSPPFSHSLPMDNRLDVSKAKKLIGFLPKTLLEKGLTQYIIWAKKNLS